MGWSRDPFCSSVRERASKRREREFAHAVKVSRPACNAQNPVLSLPASRCAAGGPSVAPADAAASSRTQTGKGGTQDTHNNELSAIKADGMRYVLPGLLAEPGNRNISPVGGSPHGGGHATAAAQRHNGAGGSGMGTRGRGGTAPQEEHMRHGHTRYGHLQAPARRSARWALCSTPTALS